jgi:hypothetical protein
MQRFLKDDAQRAQRRLRGSALRFVAVPTFGAPEMSGPGAFGAYKHGLRLAHGDRHICLLGPGGVSGIVSKLERLGRLIMRLVLLVAWDALLPAPIRGDTQRTPATASPQDGIRYQTVNRTARIDGAVTRYFCSLAGQFLENSNREWASSMTLGWRRYAEVLNR